MVDAPETLEARLRKGRLAYRTASGAVYAGPTAIETEAADRIAQLERDLAEARAEASNAQSLADWYHRTSNEATDRIWEVIGRDPTREGGQNLLQRITELVAERDRLAASRDGYAAAEKARAEEQYRLAAQCDIYKRGLETLASTFYKDDQHQDYAKHVLDAAARASLQTGEKGE